MNCYRYLEEEYVNSFLEEGKLRLSSLEKFKKYKDKERGDKTEGRSMVIDYSKGTISFSQAKANAYILCGSSELNPSIAEALQRNSCLEIKSIHDFALRIGMKIGALAYAFSKCFYENKERFLLEEKGFLPTGRQGNGRSFRLHFLRKDVEEHPNMSEIQYLEEFFIKSKNYSHQKELRIIWLLDNKVQIEESYDVVCPEAAYYCRKINIPYNNTKV